MATENTQRNYTDVQEMTIRSFPGSGPNGALTADDAAKIAALSTMVDADGKPRTAKAIISKISRMQLPYAKKERTRKDGTKPETKAALVAQISAFVDIEFESLEKAARGDVVALRDWLAENARARMAA